MESTALIVEATKYDHSVYGLLPADEDEHQGRQHQELRDAFQKAVEEFRLLLPHEQIQEHKLRILLISEKHS